MERKIGDVIEYDGQKFKIVEGSCIDCYFLDDTFLQCTELAKEFGICILGDSVNPIDIIYKLIEE